MRKNSFPYFKRKTFGLLSGLQIISGSVASAQNVHSYFEGRDIDYWRENKKVKPFVAVPHVPQNLNSEPPPSGSLIRQRDSQPFDWKNYEDPKNPEFWDDGGDYIPPRPLREAVANPTAENLERYATWQAKRLTVIAEFERKLAQNSLSRTVETKKPLTVKPITPVRLQEVQLLYFYQTSCPHCRAEKEHVESLEKKGLRVTYVQLDADSNPPLHVRSVPYNAALSKQFQVTSTPTWILRRREKSARLSGRQSDSEIYSEISKLFQNSENFSQETP